MTIENMDELFITEIKAHLGKSVMVLCLGNINWEGDLDTHREAAYNVK